MEDFPAAHSMDSTWFAVDENGEVAFFDTGEGGTMPEGDFPMGGEAGSYGKYALEEDELLARVLWTRAQSDDRLRALLPARLPQLERAVRDGDWHLFYPLLRSFGVWTYECADQDAVPYARSGDVPRPIRVDELDEEMQRRFANAKLPVRFGDEPLIEPGEFLPVQTWGPVWFDREGRPHATSGREEEFERIREDLVELGEEWFAEAEGAIASGGFLEGDELYRAVSRLVGDPSAIPDVPDRATGKQSWWRRLLGLG